MGLDSPISQLSGRQLFQCKSTSRESNAFLRSLHTSMFGGGGPFRLRLPPKDGTPPPPRHPVSCLCCIGPPDHAFETACAAVVALAIAAIAAPEAEKFTRLCCSGGGQASSGFGGDAARLSKGKAKAAAKTLRSKASGLGPLTSEELERMQVAVLQAYQPLTAGTAADTADTADAAARAQQETQQPRRRPPSTEASKGLLRSIQ